MERPSSSLTPFAWVYKRDGRLVPFEADKISRSLFAASESTGRPDAFLARELTDSILHFLSVEVTDVAPTTAQIAEFVIKIVRELGQPALARAYADANLHRQRATAPPHEKETQTAAAPAPDTSAVASPPPGAGPALPELASWVAGAVAPGQLAWRAGAAALRQYSLREIFTRDLVKAHDDGLLTLTGLETPLELAGYVLGSPRALGAELWTAIEEARAITGTLLTLDGPEYLLARFDASPDAAVDFCRTFVIAIRLANLRCVVNLNSAVPPPSEESLAMGPLFPGRRAAGGKNGAGYLDSLLEQFLSAELDSLPLRVDWHLSDRDFGPAERKKLIRPIEKVLQGAPLHFVFDRPALPVPLAEGLDRQHAGALLAVHLHLPRLLEQTSSPIDVGLFLQKLVSLGRLAISAATQKREFLRRHAQRRPALTRGFLLERARLVVVPVGLGKTAHAITGQGLCTSTVACDQARRLVQHLRTILLQDGRSYQLDTCVDSPAEFWQQGSAIDIGLSGAEPKAPVRDQLRAAGALHAAAKMGTATVFLPEERQPHVEEIVQWLDYAWQKTDLVRLRFARGSVPHGRAPGLWESSDSAQQSETHSGDSL